MSTVQTNGSAIDPQGRSERDSTVDPFSFFDGFGAPGISDDPNDSYELRNIISVGHTYVDRGMLADAEEMLHDAVASGYTRDDAVELERRIHEARHGVPEAAAIAASSLPVASPAVSADSFTRPLPGQAAQAAAVRQALAESDADLVAGRLASAYDATLRAIALGPTYLPAYVRLAELRVAHDDDDGAHQIIQTLNDALDVWDDGANWLVLSLRVSLDPDDLDALVALSHALLELKGSIQLEPYVPDAIERSLEVRSFDAALPLARDYAAVRPNDPVATRLLLRSLVLAGEATDARDAIEREVTAGATADLLCLRAAIAYQQDRTDWVYWMEQVTQRLRERPAERDSLPAVLEASRTLMPDFGYMLTVALASLASNDHRQASATLADWSRTPVSTADSREMLIAACARAFALRVTSPIESIEALARAVSEAVVIDVRPFAESCRLFPTRISADALMDELVHVATETGQQELAIMHLQALRNRLPEHLEIRTGLADLQVTAGRIGDGVRELRYIAERYEQAGNFDRMVEAMRRISNAVPTNAEMKAKLIEGYIQRGIPDEATRELRLLGDLHKRKNRTEAAADAYRRGAEIAATTGRVADAIDLFDRVIAATPDDVAHRHAAVAFHIMNGAVERATQQLREIVRIALAADDPDEAVAALHQIIGLAPADAAAYHKLGEVLTSLGEYAQAERVYRRLGSLTSDDPVLAAKQSALAALAAGS